MFGKKYGNNISFYLKVKNNGKELWFSPAGSYEEYLLTKGRIDFKEVRRAKYGFRENLSIFKR